MTTHYIHPDRSAILGAAYHAAAAAQALQRADALNCHTQGAGHGYALDGLLELQKALTELRLYTDRSTEESRADYTYGVRATT